MLTTHYMDEAERLCDRVAIIDQGKIIALGSPAQLIARLGGEHVVEFALGGDDTSRRGEFRLGRPRPRRPRRGRRLRADRRRAPPAPSPRLLDELDKQHRPLARLTTRQVSLEDVFVSLTGRHLRDNEPEEAQSQRQGRAAAGAGAEPL